jgi:hypothetical protein
MAADRHCDRKNTASQAFPGAVQEKTATPSRMRFAGFSGRPANRERHRRVDHSLGDDAANDVFQGLLDEFAAARRRYHVVGARQQINFRSHGDPSASASVSAGFGERHA